MREFHEAKLLDKTISTAEYLESWKILNELRFNEAQTYANAIKYEQHRASIEAIKQVLS